MTLGPIQEEDKLLLQAVVKMISPKIIIEFGYLNGYSTDCFLEVMNQDAKIISYDNTATNKTSDLRHTFILKSQDEFEMVNDVDLVFFDASHDFALNCVTFEKVKESLKDTGIIAVHDTGLWNDMIMDTGGHWINGSYAHRPDERDFVNWIKDNYPEYQIINFHTTDHLRHGMTLIQKYKKLDI